MTAPLGEAEERAKEVARLIKGALPEGWGFFLCLTDFKEKDGEMLCVSSIKREGCVKLLREMADILSNALCVEAEEKKERVRRG
jgi:hypothetical protein